MESSNIEKKVRPIFIYLALFSIVLGTIGIFIIEKQISGKATLQEDNKEVVKRFIDKEEVAKHNSTEDCWVYFNDRVYDITQLIQIYPYDLSQECGKELKVGYFSENDFKILEDCKIGVVK